MTRRKDPYAPVFPVMAYFSGCKGATFLTTPQYLFLLFLSQYLFLLFLFRFLLFLVFQALKCGFRCLFFIIALLLKYASVGSLVIDGKIVSLWI